MRKFTLTDIMMYAVINKYCRNKRFFRNREAFFKKSNCLNVLYIYNLHWRSIFLNKQKHGSLQRSIWELKSGSDLWSLAH